MKVDIRDIFVLILCAASAGCGDTNLRGEVTSSADGKTYFGIKEMSPACAAVKIDGKAWIHPVGTVAPITPGDHILDCGGTYGFTVDRGTVMRFDYWGP